MSDGPQLARASSGLPSPIPPASDPADPLGPVRLRALIETAQQALHNFEVIRRTDRNPYADPGWPIIKTELQAALRDAADAHATARAEFKLLRPVVMRPWPEKLDAAFYHEIRAGGQRLVEVWGAWRTAQSLIDRIAAVLHVKADGFERPPETIG